MGVEWKKTVPVFALVLLVVLIGVVVAVATRQSHPDIVGLYADKNGLEIRFGKNGTFTDVLRPPWGLEPREMNHYWVSGNYITIGDSKTEPEGPATFKIKGKQLIGYGTLWTRKLVEPNRPAPLLGTYTSSDGESLALDKNGAVYDVQQLPSGSSAKMGIWVAGNDAIKVMYQVGPPGQTATYTISGKNLVGGDKEFVKKSNDVIVPMMPYL